jgi:hypothetical protein
MLLAPGARQREGCWSPRIKSLEGAAISRHSTMPTELLVDSFSPPFSGPVPPCECSKAPQDAPDWRRPARHDSGLLLDEGLFLASHKTKAQML